MRFSDLRENMLVQDRQRTVFKVSTVHHRRVTMQVMLENGEVPPRTAVRSLSPKDVTNMRPATSTMVHRMEDAWGLPPLGPRNRGEELILGAGEA